MLANPESLATAIMLAQEKKEAGTLRLLQTQLNFELKRREEIERGKQEATTREMANQLVDFGVSERLLTPERAARIRAAIRGGAPTLMYNLLEKELGTARDIKKEEEEKRRWEAEYAQKERLTKAGIVSAEKIAGMPSRGKIITPEEAEQEKIDNAWARYFKWIPPRAPSPAEMKVYYEMDEAYLTGKKHKEYGYIKKRPISPWVKVNTEFAKQDPQSAEIVFPDYISKTRPKPKLKIRTKPTTLSEVITRPTTTVPTVPKTDYSTMSDIELKNKALTGDTTAFLELRKRGKI